MVTLKPPIRFIRTPTDTSGLRRFCNEYDIIKIKIHSSCEIEYFVETHLCNLCVIKLIHSICIAFEHTILKTRHCICLAF